MKKYPNGTRVLCYGNWVIIESQLGDKVYDKQCYLAADSGFRGRFDSTHASSVAGSVIWYSWDKITKVDYSGIDIEETYSVFN